MSQDAAEDAIAAINRIVAEHNAAYPEAPAWPSGALQDLAWSDTIHLLQSFEHAVFYLWQRISEKQFGAFDLEYDCFPDLVPLADAVGICAMTITASDTILAAQKPFVLTYVTWGLTLLTKLTAAMEQAKGLGRSADYPHIAAWQVREAMSDYPHVPVVCEAVPEASVPIKQWFRAFGERALCAVGSRLGVPDAIVVGKRRARTDLIMADWLESNHTASVENLSDYMFEVHEVIIDYAGARSDVLNKPELDRLFSNVSAVRRDWYEQDMAAINMIS
jgi:hypothetical protein